MSLFGERAMSGHFLLLEGIINLLEECVKKWIKETVLLLHECNAMWSGGQNGDGDIHSTRLACMYGSDRGVSWGIAAICVRDVDARLL